MRNQSYRPLPLRVHLHHHCTRLSSALGGSLLPTAKKRSRAAVNLLVSFTLVVAILVSSFPYAAPTRANNSTYRSASTQGRVEGPYGAESEPMSKITAQGDTLLPASQRDKLDSFGKLPLSFEPNAGQTDPAARFLVHAPGGMFFFTPSGVVLALKEPAQMTASSDPLPSEPASTSISQTMPSAAPSITPPPRVVRMHFIDANSSTAITAGEILPGKVNYMLGKDASTWHMGLPTYSSITYQALYAGVELKYDSADGQLKGTYTVAPGSDPGRIRWRYEGVDRLSVDGAGNLQAGFASTLSAGQPITITEQAPVVWQEIDGRAVPVSASYKVAADNSVSFALGTYDRAHPLTIDPYLTYSTYLGGNGSDSSNSIAIDSAGNAYIAGSTASTDFPISGAYQPTNGGGSDAYITKVNATGSALLYSTYLGGRYEDHGTGIAVDAAGNAYMSGHSTSGNYPIFNQYQRQNKGQEDFILTKLTTSGAMAYSTYLGGTDKDWGNAIAVDGAGNAYLAGETQPPCSGLNCSGYTTNAFPTKNAYSTTGRGWADALVAKINTNLSGNTSLVYSTYLGGTDGDGAYAIAVDGNGNSYVTGITWYRQNFPLVNPYQSDTGSRYGEDAFVTKFNASGNALVYSTYLGGHYRPYTGDGIDVGFGIAVDGSGSAYVTGRTNSLDFPVQNAIQPAKFSTGIDHEAFITKFNPLGNTVAYSTYLGGNGDDIGGEIVVDATGNASVAGQTASTNFRVVDAYQSTNQGSSDAFVTKLNSAGSNLLSSTYLGGSGGESANGIAVNNLGDTYIGGTTNSANFPTTPGAYRTTGNAGNSAFLTKLTDNTPKANECYGGGNPVIATTQPFGCGDSVNTATGNFWTSSTDIAIAGRGLPLNFTRTYNSLAANQNGPLGYGWTHSYNMYIDRDANGNYLVHQENGSVAPFRPDLSRLPRVEATLTYTNSTYIFTRMHGQDRLHFEAVAGGAPNVYRLRRIIDRNDHTTLLTYTNGLLQTVADPAGRTFTFNYTNGLLISLTDNTGARAVVYHYDANGDLDVVYDVGARTTRYSYQNHLLRTITDANNGVVTNSYDSLGRLLTQTDPTNQPPLRLEYLAGSTRITNTLDLVTVHEYDAGKLRKVIEYPGAQQAVTSYDYKPGTNYVSSVTDPLLHTTRYAWDDNGNVLSINDPLARTTGYAYNNTNDLTVITHPDTVTTTLSYDPRGNLLSATRLLTGNGQSVPIVTSFTYDQTPARRGDLRTITDARLNVWELTYDQNGYPDVSMNPPPFTSETTDYDYDSIGRLDRVRDARNNTTTLAHNAYNQVTNVTNALTHTTVYTYDAVGNLEYVMDPKRNVVTNTYTLNNQVERTIQPDGTFVRYDYDAAGRVLTETNLLGKSTSYNYRDLDRRISVTYPVTGTTTRTVVHQYDPAGNLDYFLNEAQTNRKTDYTYDAANQLINLNYDDPDTDDVSFAYTALGLRDIMTDGIGTTDYDYDTLGRLSMAKVTAAGSTERRVDYEYDPIGNITKITYPQNRDGLRRFVVRTFDEAGRMKTVGGNLLAASISFDYDPNGNLRDITYPGIGDLHTTVISDEVNRVISMTHSLSNGPLYSLDYERDANGLVDMSLEMQPGKPDATHYYDYDSRNRLKIDNMTSSSSTLLSLFDLDAAGQITQSTSYPIPGQRTYMDRRYDDANRLYELVERTDSSTTRSLSYLYSDTGNRTAQIHASTGITITTYEYDQANRLTGFINHLTNDVGVYTYNGDGLRMSKLQGLSFIDFTWDIAQGLPLLLYDGVAAYVYGPGGMLLAQGVEPGMGGSPNQEPTTTPDTQPQPAKSAPAQAPEAPSVIASRYYVTDQSGSVIALVRGDGTVLDRYSYEAYGRRTCSPCGPYNPMGYAGQYQDSESNPVYMRARYYDPDTQQFISRDPLVGLSGQPYVYAGANPVNATDPSGQILETVADGVAIGMDLHDIQSEGLNWGNGTALVLDVAGALVPFIPSVAGHVRRGGKMLSHADDVTDATSNVGRIKVIGNSTDTERYLNNPLYDVLDLPMDGPGKWTWRKNKQWLNEAADQGHPFLVVSDTQVRSNLVNLPHKRHHGYYRVLGREIKYLQSRGYIQEGDYMVKRYKVP